MFVDDKRSWIRTIASGAVLPRIWRRMLVVTALSIGMTIVYRTVPAFHVSLSPTPFALIGVPLGIFLGFRNTSSYDRFWEARKLWGSLVNTTRTLTRQILTLAVPADADEATLAEVRAFQVRWVHTVIAYVYALKHHLRNQPLHAAKKISLSTDALDRAITAPDDNPPLAVLQELGDLLLEARLRRFIDPLHVPAIDASISAMTDVQGACERIKSTPIPFSYTVLMHRIVAAYCGLLPFGVAEAIGWATPVVVLFVSYALFGLDAIGEEIEQPFGLDTNDLPLSAVTRTIEINLRARLGEVTLPPPKKAKRGVLR